MHHSDFQLSDFILLVVFVVPAILFLLTQYKILRAFRPENRRMNPWLVWLQLLPFFGLVWGFIVVIRIAGSAYRQRLNYREDSIVGMAPDDVKHVGKRPTLGIGIAWCVLWIVDLPMLFLTKMSDGVQIFHALLTLTQITCWIIYWVLLFRLWRNIRKEAP